MDPAGKITGNGSGSARNFVVRGYSADMDFTFSMKGTVQTSGNVVRANLTMKLKGNGTVAGYACTMTGTLTEKLELDPTGRAIIGTAKGSVSVVIPSIHRHGSASIPTQDLDIPLPDDASGQWDLSLTINTNKTKYTGSGSILLANSNNLPVAVMGTYAAKTGLSKFTLKGQGLAKAVSMSLAVVCTNDVLTVKSLTGKALGQNLKFTTK